MYLCQKLRGVSYVNYVLTCIICFILSRSVWSSSRFADQWFGELWEWRDLFIQTKPKKKKIKKKKAPSQPSKQHQGYLLRKRGQPFWQPEPGVLLFETGWRAATETCEEQPRSRSMQQLLQGESWRTKHIDPLFCAEGKAPGSRKAAWGWKRLLLAIFSCFCIRKKTQHYFSEEGGFSASWESLLGKGNLLVGKNFWRRINFAQERDESQQGSGGEWS